MLSARSVRFLDRKRVLRVTEAVNILGKELKGIVSKRTEIKKSLR